MKDLFSKATFGFLMAQFVPGAITLCSLTFVYFALQNDAPNSIRQLLALTAGVWSGSLFRQIVLVGLCTGAGMLIHGLHWAVLGYLENRYESAFRTFWHDRRILWQILLGPIQLVAEMGGLIFRGTDLKSISLKENVPHIPKDRFEQFQFVQDFYLNFAQFYAHSSYALVVSFLALVSFTLASGPTLPRLLIAALLWLLAGLFFVISRIQLYSLFWAEEQMKSMDSAASEEATT